MKFYVVLLMLLALGGCSSRYLVTFDSTPRGATLVCGNTHWGHTPRNLYFDKSYHEKSSIDVSSCSANWVSGARESYPSNLKIFPQRGTITSLKRAPGDGYAQDASYALQLRQVQAAENAAAEAKRQNNKVISCSTNSYGTTTCY